MSWRSWPAAGRFDHAAGHEVSAQRDQVPSAAADREGEATADPQSLVGEGVRRLDEVLGPHQCRRDDAADDRGDAADDAGNSVLAAACGVGQLTTRLLLLLTEQLLQKVGPGGGKHPPDACLVAAVRPALHDLACDVLANLLRQVLLSTRQVVEHSR